MEISHHSVCWLILYPGFRAHKLYHYIKSKCLSLTAVGWIYLKLHNLQLFCPLLNYTWTIENVFYVYTVKPTLFSTLFVNSLWTLLNNREQSAIYMWQHGFEFCTWYMHLIIFFQLLTFLNINWSIVKLFLQLTIDCRSIFISR